jgi:glutathione S-transferase
MTITLWGRLSSANVQKAVWALEELGLSYEHIPLGGRFGGNATAEYLAMNPNGLVPTLRDGDLVVWESHAIVRYLAAAYGAGSLFPADPRERAIVDQWTDWTATTFQPAWINLFWLLVRTPPAHQDRVAIDKAIQATSRCFGIMDKRLGEAPFLGGERLSYADIVAGVALYRWTTMEIDRPVLQSVESWHARLGERAAFRKAVNVDYEELRGRLAF